MEDPASPAAAYRRLHGRLVGFFATRGAADPGALADATFNRLARKLVREPMVVHEPASHLIAVARLVWREQVRREQVRQRALHDYEAAQADDVAERDRRAAVLARCLGELSSGGRTLLLAYDRSSGDGRIAERRALVERLGVSCAALRMRMSRLRAQLRRRVLQQLAVLDEAQATAREYKQCSDDR